MFRDKLDINKSVMFFGIGKMLLYLFFLFEFLFILISPGVLFSLSVLNTLFCNLLCVILFNIFNNAYKVSKKAKEISLKCFGDTIYDSCRIKERREFFRIEKQRLLQKRLEIEQEIASNDLEINNLETLLNDVFKNINDIEKDNIFLESTFERGNFMQQLILCKRR